MNTSITLTLDVTLDDWGVQAVAMRWVPPEQAAEIRAEGARQEAWLRDLRERNQGPRRGVEVAR